jgi:hypothetical protein
MKIAKRELDNQDNQNNVQFLLEPTFKERVSAFLSSAKSESKTN